jgi:hypothetical protein
MVNAIRLQTLAQILDADAKQYREASIATAKIGQPIGQSFDVGEIVRFIPSGKEYVTTGFTGRDNSRVGVYGWRNGKQFGPVRFLDAGKLERVTR